MHETPHLCVGLERRATVSSVFNVTFTFGDFAVNQRDLVDLKYTGVISVNIFNKCILQGVNLPQLAPQIRNTAGGTSL